MAEAVSSDRTATFLREQAVEAYKSATEHVTVRKDKHGAATHWGRFYALAEAYAFHTEQPVDMVTEVLEAEAESA